MLRLAGPAAETVFRLSKLREQLRSSVDAVSGVSVNFLHFALLRRPLTGPERTVLDALLAYGAAAERPVGDFEVVVIPRVGTISS